MNPYEVGHIRDLEQISIAGVNWRPIRRALGIRAFGINAYTGDEGEHVVEEHSEETLGHEEVYVVVAGRARFTLADEDVDVDSGGFVFVRDPSTQRAAIALEDGTAVLAVGGKPGEAHRPSAWESWFAASPYRRSGDYERGLAIVREGLAEDPDDPARNFQVAAFEALLGNRGEALERLRFATDRRAEMREWARGHAAFESLRDDAEFLAIAGEPDAGGEGT